MLTTTETPNTEQRHLKGNSAPWSQVTSSAVSPSLASRGLSLSSHCVVPAAQRM